MTENAHLTVQMEDAISLEAVCIVIQADGVSIVKTLVLRIVFIETVTRQMDTVLFCSLLFLCSFWTSMMNVQALIPTAKIHTDCQTTVLAVLMVGQGSFVMKAVCMKIVLCAVQQLMIV